MQAYRSFLKELAALVIVSTTNIVSLSLSSGLFHLLKLLAQHEIKLK